MKKIKLPYALIFYLPTLITLVIIAIVLLIMYNKSPQRTIETEPFSVETYDTLILKVEFTVDEHEIVLTDQNNEAYILLVENAFDPVFDKGSIFYISKRRLKQSFLDKKLFPFQVF